MTMSNVFVSVQQEDFSVAALLQTLTIGQGNVGAMANFIGFVRHDTRCDISLSRLFLEHYPGMTERSLRDLAQKALERFQLQAVLIIHRIGELLPGEKIVLVATTATHRKNAIQSVDFLMDHLKSSVPFWKKEKYGDEWYWVDAKQSDQEALHQWQNMTF